MPLIEIQQLAAPEMAAVDAVIRTQLHSEVVLVRQVSEYIIGGGGKRLRPLLHVLAARALGYQGQHHHTLAAVVEFIHTATLLHDDVVDASDMRRGRKTANQLFGNAAAVLVGDFSNQMLGLYHNEGNGLFVDEAPSSTVGRASLLSLSFGVLFLRLRSGRIP